MNIQLLALVASMSLDPEALLAENCCLTSYTEKQLLAMQAQLLQFVVDGGAGAGAQQVYQDHTGSPPADPTRPAVSFPSGGGMLSQWDVPSQTWK